MTISNIAENKILIRILTLFITFVIILTMVPVKYAAAESTPAPYTFVVTSDKTKADVGETVTITITAKGPMAYARMVQAYIHFKYEDFEYSKPGADWNTYVSAGNGLGAIKKNPVGNISADRNDSTKKRILVGYVNSDGLYIDETNGIFNSQSAVVAVLEFNALKTIEDISESFTIASTANAFVNEDGTPSKQYSQKDHKLIQLTETIKAKKVYDMIDNLPDTISYADKSAVEAARTAYNNLGNETYADILKGLVTNYAILQAAEVAIAEIDGQISAFKTAVGALPSVDEIRYNPEDTAEPTLKDKINAANVAYSAITDTTAQGLDDVKAAKSTLDNVSAKYAEHTTAYEVAKPINDRIAILKTKEKVEYSDGTEINAIDVAIGSLSDLAKTYVKSAELELVRAAWNELATLVTNFNEIVGGLNANSITLADEAKIDEAAALYAKMDEGQQDAVATNKAKLDICVNELNALKVNNVETLIDAIGTIEYTAESVKRYNDAYTAYDALDDDGLDVDDNHKETYSSAKAKYDQLMKDVSALVSSIEGLPNPSKFTLDDEDELDTILGTYATLFATDAEKEYFEEQHPNENDKLMTCDAERNSLVAERNKEIAADIISLIGEIPDDGFTIDDIEKINAAWRSYANIVDNPEIDYGDDIVKLINASDYDAIQKLKDAKTELDKNITPAEKVYTEIKNNIKADELPAKETVKELEEKYGALSSDAQAYVSNYNLLSNAREVWNVIDMIAKLAEKKVELTDEYLVGLEAVEGAYDALSSLDPSVDLQELVSNKGTLTTLREKYNELVQESENRVNASIDEIKAILSAGVTLESGGPIAIAKNNYSGLSDDEKAKVNAEPDYLYDELLKAEEKYKELLNAEADRVAALKAIASEIDGLIENIGNVTLGSKSKIDAAREVYNENAAAQMYVTLLDVLEAAEAEYDRLEKEETDVQGVISTIDGIFGFTTLEELLENIKDSNDAYSNLLDNYPEIDKTRVTNYSDIALAEELKALIEAIDALDIDSIEYTPESEEAINDLKYSYNTLINGKEGEDGHPELADKVINVDKLLEAEKKYKEVSPRYSLKQIPGYDNLYMVIYGNVGDDKIVTLGNNTAAKFEYDLDNDGEIDDFYYVILTRDGTLDANDVVITDGESIKHILGDADGSGDVMGNDAKTANAKAARVEEAENMFAEDFMPYVRSDPNGDGRITAVDALIIARMSINDIEGIEFGFCLTPKNIVE